MSSSETARFLAGSPDRLRLLSKLHRQPGSPADLAESLSISHRSVQRNLARFVDRGWAAKRDGRYTLTTIGALVADEHASYIDTLDVIEEYGPFYRHLPDREHAPEPRWLEEATLVAATPENPQAPVHHYIERLRTFETETVRMLSPVLSRLFHDAHAELAIRGAHTELVLSTAMVERARTLNPAEFAVVVSVGVLDLYRHPEAVDFGLTIGDRRLLVGAYDEQGQLRACVESTDADFRQWADDLFERYRGRSERVEPTLSPPFAPTNE